MIIPKPAEQRRFLAIAQRSRITRECRFERCPICHGFPHMTQIGSEHVPDFGASAGIRPVSFDIDQRFPDASCPA